MISRDDLPADAAEWSAVRIAFDYLANDSAASCPLREADVLRYLQSESGDAAKTSIARLTFVRTAKVLSDQYWAWRYVEVDGAACYVTFCIRPDGTSVLSLAASNGLSIEQFLLASHYDEVYWA